MAEPAAKRRRVRPVRLSVARAAERRADRCKWLEEALGKNPRTWTADSVHEFETCILGEAGLGTKLVVRKCYVDMGRIAEEWVKTKHKATPTIGLYVVTGTPGVGKSVFQAYMVAQLAADGFTIVVQCGARFFSRRAGGPTVNCGQDMPVELLEDPMTVLLADPLGGGNKHHVEHRAAGCTIVFTSPNQQTYDTAWKQGLAYATRRFMPTWSKDELVKHRLVVLPLLTTDEEVATAFELLGGSLRWLVVLSQEKGEDMREAARVLVEQYVAAATYEDLLRAGRSEAARIEEATKTSRLSYVLQINTDDHKVARVELLKSEVAITAIQKELASNAAMDVTALGSTVGNLFKKTVLDKLTAKGTQQITLECKPLPGPGDPWRQRVPNQKTEVQTAAAKAQKTPFATAFLHVPLSETFPAADFFFVDNSGATLVLLKTTKDTTHSCKIDAMRQQLKHSFTDDALNSVGAIKWIVLAPPTTAAKYTTAQTVTGTWGGGVAVAQYVAEWA